MWWWRRSTASASSRARSRRCEFKRPRSGPRFRPSADLIGRPTQIEVDVRTYQEQNLRRRRLGEGQMRSAVRAMGALVLSAMCSGAAMPAHSAPHPDVLNGGANLVHRERARAGARPCKGLHWSRPTPVSEAYEFASVIDCHGAVRARIGLGRVEIQKPGPVVAGRSTLVVIYHPDWGSNIQILNVELLQYRNGSIAELWDHPSLNGAYPPKGMGPWQETIYRWRFTSNARRIEVTGRDVVYRDEEPHRRIDISRMRSLKSEHFCLNSKATKYLPCG